MCVCVCVCTWKESVPESIGAGSYCPEPFAARQPFRQGEDEDGACGVPNYATGLLSQLTGIDGVQVSFGSSNSNKFTDTR